MRDSSRIAIADSSQRQTSRGKFIDRITASRLYQMTFVGVPLVAGGLIVKGEDTHFRKLRNDYLPYFHRTADNYLQYAPAAVMLAMKAAGVQSRSSWGRMWASGALSAALMGGTVYALKQTTQVRRPDGSNKHSFPSGHTATAFMTATMLTKEYGQRYPWIGIGAYSVASATGLMRMANNKHWLSDVMTGAGIGILSTEVGYYLADLLFKEKSLNPIKNEPAWGNNAKPSFISLYLGMNIPISHYDIDEEHAFRTSSGSSAGVEGAYFFNKHFGLGGRFTVSNTQIIVNNHEAESNTFDAKSLVGGTFVSFPLTDRWLVGSKLLTGYVHYPKLNLSDQSIPPRGGFTLGSGASLTFRQSTHYGMRFFLDYNLLPSHSRHTREWMNTLTLGSAFLILL